MNITVEGYERCGEPHDFKIIKGVGVSPNGIGIIKGTVGNHEGMS